MPDLGGGQDFVTFLSDPDLLQLMLFACPDGVVATDERDRIVLYTGASEQMFGFAPFEVMHEEFGILFASPREYARLRRDIAMTGTVANLEIQARRRDTAAFPAAVSAAALRDRYGGYLGTVLYIRDHTEARALQERMRSNAERLGTLVIELDYAARHDRLTGLLYRAAALDAAEAELLRQGLHRRHFGVAILDVDRFKTVNDSYGHLGGDAVLSRLAAILRDTARHEDIIGRFGGEEFIAFLPGAGLDDTHRFAERVRDAVERAELPMSAELRIHVTVSAGVASLPSCADSLNEAIRVADDRLYEAKRAGRNQVVGGSNSAPGRNAA